jgi:DNA-binding beta-propeller fold protein YncE
MTRASVRRRFVCVVCLLLPVLFPATAWAGSYRYVTAWGLAGADPAQPSGAIGIAVDRSGNVFVSEADNDRVQKYDSSGAFLTRWGTPGDGPGQFHGPMDIAVDASGNVYVADVNNARVQKFDNSGRYLAQWGSNGTGNGQFAAPVGLAVDVAGAVYVCDENGCRVQKFDSSGAYLAQFGTPGTALGQLDMPVGVAVDATGDVYVTESGTNIGVPRVQTFKATGAPIGIWGSPGVGPGQFALPIGIAVDGAGSAYVVDCDLHRVQVFDRSGRYLETFGTQGDGDGQFYLPTRVAIDRGRILVLDAGHDRVEVFAAPLPATLSLTSTTHPDPTKWYANARPAFTWSSDGAAAGYHVELKLASAAPPDALDAFTQAGASFTAPGRLKDGVHKLYVAALTGAAGGPCAAGTTATCQVRIDATKPTATILKAPAVAVARGQKVRVRYRVRDGIAVAHAWLVVTVRGKQKKVLSVPIPAKQGTHTVSWRCTVKKAGLYSLRVVAADRAGNRATSKSRPLTVR